MLSCRNCDVAISNRRAQQSLSEMDATISVLDPSLSTYRKAMQNGPLCATCLTAWHKSFHSTAQEGSDTRSPAIRALDEACLRLEPQSD